MAQQKQRARAGQRMGLVLWALCSGWMCAQGVGLAPGNLGSGTSGTVAPLAPALRHGRELLAQRDLKKAGLVFKGYLKAHPNDVQAELGIGDVQLAEHAFETAEATYRKITAQQPQLWQAHKNLVVVEAALGRWDDFHRERKVLSMARERGAPGIGARDSDVIDSFTVHGERWVVRSYFLPVGRSRARYNFECFSAEGRVRAYVSLEELGAAEAALTPQDVRVGGADAKAQAASPQPAMALNWYTGTAHGEAKVYKDGEPPYERLRSDVIRWLQTHPAIDRGHAGP